MAQVLRPKVFGTLIADVIRKGLCCGCGACVASCPVCILTMKGEQPTIVDRCINCEICYNQCPKTDRSLEEFERTIFSRTRRADETFGVSRAVFSGIAQNPDAKKGATDGGVVTALLTYALDRRIIDGAVVSSLSKSDVWKPEPKVALTSSEVLESTGTKYTSCPMLLGLMTAVRDMGLRNVAFVGTGCRIEAVRKSQFVRKEYWGLGKRARLSLGLFCMESFTERLLREYLPSQQVRLDEITKFHIAKGRFVAYKGDETVLKVPVRDLANFATSACHSCTDATAELADLSFGGIGAEPGWTTIVVRSDAGETILKEASDAGYIETKPLPQEGIEAIVRFNSLKSKKV